MKRWFDGNFWGRYFQQQFIPQINLFCDTLLERFLPTFDTVDQEAESLAESIFENFLQQTYGWDGMDVDISSAADQAMDKSIEYYQRLLAVYQTYLNLSLVGLYHMYEQQLYTFHRRQLLHPNEENDLTKLKFKKIIELLSKYLKIM